MSRTVKVSGDLVLPSPESEALYQSLAESGLLFEYISGIFDSQAKGLAAAELVALRKLVEEILRKVDNIAITGVRADNRALTPEVAISEATGPETDKNQPAAEVSVDLGRLAKGNLKSVFKKGRGFLS